MHGPYDALLLVSFGGPEGPDDVMPFLENVTRGRGIPRERLLGVAEHYQHFGGVSPINEQNRALIAALEEELARQGVDLPVHWGNRNWGPYLGDTVAELADAGVQRVLAVVTSAYSSYSGCRQYREDLAAAVEPLGDRAPRIDKLRHYFDSPGFVRPTVRAVIDALGEVPAGSVLRFVTHSIPTAMNDVSGGPGEQMYVRQHRAVASLVVAGVEDETGRRVPWELVYCSRSGPPSQPWLEPDVNDDLRELHAQGVPGVVVVPIGFVSDHMEVKFDLDTEAAETAQELGLPYARAATVGTDPEFVAGLVDLVRERAATEAGEDVERVALSAVGPWPDRCPVGCCANLRGYKPALCGQD
ncbi:ferrochelatase [Motilibacter rhizosphaerae]|uniref:Coproporphyrin III ferrochelatase n=1 Tax=Motilibacter rhizosphaerae TaxID=598652 RepID=A0A4Q7NGY0_9ACTN|nr:ferrochelatase [Motilibacter rhizosphaerae]RZS82978.1 ferrochelatase [Motilibacter rhizosphaerae]